MRKGTAIALSGGGFRAAMFHAGALIRLNELGLLRKISRFIGVSGGAITLGCLATGWRKLAWTAGVAENLDQVLVDPMRKFCASEIDVASIIEGAVRPRTSIADVVARKYRQHLFGAANLPDLPRTPTFIFQATNLATGRAFRFYRSYVADYLIGKAPSDGITIATAVAASSAFPPMLSPVTLKIDPAKFTKVLGAKLYDDISYRRELRLSDGGVYDNLGLEPAWDSETVLVSDAGAPFEYVAAPDVSWVQQTMRAFAIATDQSRALRKRWLIDQFVRKVRKGTYWGITTKITDYPVHHATIDRAVQEKLIALRTRLNPFNAEEQGRLLNLGYAMASAACQSHLEGVPAIELRWPAPQFPV